MTFWKMLQKSGFAKVKLGALRRLGGSQKGCLAHALYKQETVARAIVEAIVRAIVRTLVRTLVRAIVRATSRAIVRAISREHRQSESMMVRTN